MEAPILGKNPPHVWDHQEMTWARFLNLRKWAQHVADETGWKVYLVGSTLTKEVPRDFDVSVIMPAAEYEHRFGPWPEDHTERCHYMNRVWGHGDHVRYYFEGREALGEQVNFDLKFCPDTWWPEKDKLLLAEPRG